jgi:hypothetical protein
MFNVSLQCSHATALMYLRRYKRISIREFLLKIVFILVSYIYTEKRSCRYSLLIDIVFILRSC